MTQKKAKATKGYWGLVNFLAMVYFSSFAFWGKTDFIKGIGFGLIGGWFTAMILIYIVTNSPSPNTEKKENQNVKNK